MKIFYFIFEAGNCSEESFHSIPGQISALLVALIRVQNILTKSKISLSKFQIIQNAKQFDNVINIL